jgi:predicted nucleic acid-binding Zn ribbon protein
MKLYRGRRERPQYSAPVAAPKRNWIQEERRKTLGDWVAFCLHCGHTLRYFLEYEDALPDACPQCGGELRHRCPACAAPIASAFAVTCEECGAPVREPVLFGTAIRKPGK